MKDHCLIDERSLAFDRLIADKVRANPRMVERARGNLLHWLETCSPRARATLLEWRDVLDGPLSELLRMMTATDERAVRLRQSSPFCGILSRAERSRILKEFQSHETVGA
ncbi:MAG: hypothetical protein WCN98_09220 [Verrucomicrobiaceae bacterium]